MAASRGDDISSEFTVIERWVNDRGDAGVLASFEGLRADKAISEGRYADACDALLLAAASDTLNAPTHTRMAGTLALIDADAPRAEKALAAFNATGIHGRLWDLDRQLLRTGIAALTEPTGAELRSFRDVIDGYRDMSLPYRLAWAVVVLLATRGDAELEVAGLVAEAQAIARRLGAKPILRDLDRLRAASAGAVADRAPQGSGSARIPSAARD